MGGPVLRAALDQSPKLYSDSLCAKPRSLARGFPEALNPKP